MASVDPVAWLNITHIHRPPVLYVCVFWLDRKKGSEEERKPSTLALLPHQKDPSYLQGQARNFHNVNIAANLPVTVAIILKLRGIVANVLQSTHSRALAHKSMAWPLEEPMFAQP